MEKTQPQLKLDKEITKIYWSIGEVKEMFGVSESQIRYWESEFEALTPKRSRKGTRMFTKADIDVIKMIYHLLYEKGMTSEGARKFLKERPDLLGSKLQTVNALKNLKMFLEEMRDKI